MKGFVAFDDIALVHSGTNYFEILEKIIDEAKYTIHFQTYIFSTDDTSMKIVRAFERAAKRGVTVHVMVDAFGSTTFAHKQITELKDQGVYFRKYSPLFSSEAVFFGRRLHWKILVADKNVSLTGGINVANKYNEQEKMEPWLDYAVITKGACCEYLHLLCETMFYRRSSRALQNWQKQMYVRAHTHKLIGFRINDWIKGRNEIYQSYLHAIKSAKSEITVVSSYFLPGLVFRRAMAQAVARGVTVNVILAGKSDVSTVHSAEIYLYDFYLSHDIRVFEWNNSVMHGKAMVVDRIWATIGSYNINFLSRFISIELNTDVDNKRFSGEFALHLDEIIAAGCKRIKKTALEKRRNLYFRVKIWLAYNFYRFLMNIFVKERVKS